MEMLETPQVCTSVMKVAGEELHTEREDKGLHLADTALSCMESPELGILIGGDITGKCCRENQQNMWITKCT
jgi:hypothetical protein